MTDELSADLELPACPNADCEANCNGLFTIRSTNAERFECVRCGERWS